MRTFQYFPASVVILGLCVQGCYPTNVVTGPSPTTSVPLADLSDVSHRDGAQGQCQNLPDSSSERLLCMACYDAMLETHCPGKTDPSQCSSTIANTFTNLVNQCISQSTLAGFLCTKTCSTGQVLQASSCSCITPGSGGTSLGPIDVGQTDFGPPIVTTYWSGDATVTNSSEASCEADLSSVQFLVRNRGDTVPLRNQYSVETTCAETTATAPALLNGTLQSQISIATTGRNAYVGGNIWDFESGTANWTVEAGAAATRSLARITNYLGDGAGDLGNVTARLTVPANQTPGQYLLTLDLLIRGSWYGAGSTAEPAHSENPLTVRAISNGAESTIFRHSFSTANSPTPSYPRTKATLLDQDLNNILGGVGTDSLYRLNIPFRHTCPTSAPCSLAVTFKAENLVGGTWGLDNVGVLAVPSCTVKYQFTDTNQLTSSYCMKLDLLTTCGASATSSNTVSCGCWGNTPIDGSSVFSACAP